MTSFQKAVKYAAMALAILLTVSIVGGILSALTGVSVLFGDEAVGEMKTYTPGGGIHALDVDIGAADLTVKAGDSWGVESNHKRLTVEEKDGTLYVEENSGWFADHTGATLEITIPGDVVPLTYARLNTGAGRVTIDELAAERLELSLGAGEVTIGRLTATEGADIDGGAGAITIRGGSLHDLDLDMGVGDLKLTSELSGESELDLGVGAADVTLTGDADDYRILLSKGLGRALLNGQEVSGGTYGSGSISVEIDGGVGEIRVTTE